MEEENNLLIYKNAVIEESSITAADGKKYRTKLYNLNAIIADLVV